MAWNEPGNNNDKDRDPWKNTGKSQIPPDLDKLLKSIWARLSGTFGSQTPTNAGGGTGLAVFALLAVVVASTPSKKQSVALFYGLVNIMQR
jgi:membrane protease subunit HflK